MNTYISKEELQEIKQLDLLTYLQNYDTAELIKKSRNTYGVKSHSSVSIDLDGGWRRWSRGINGRSALDYLIKVEEYAFLEAAHHLKSLLHNTPPVFVEQVSVKNTNFTLPDKNSNSLTACKYLIHRGIDKNIIAYCIYEGFLYETKTFHNVVFTGKDADGNICYASLRGTNKQKFHGEVANSDKRFSFSLTLNPKNTTLHIFECPIDLLSHATIINMEGKNWKEENYLSLAGVYMKNNENKPMKAPLALEEYLKNHPYIKTIVTHLDNDEVGIGATSLIKEYYQNRYTIVDKTPKLTKDVNALLCLKVRNHKDRKQECVR
jgi:hypothetical protein